MNEPPAGRKARNYRPDQRPHAARPGRQRDLAPLKRGERGAGRPGAGHRFRSGLLGRRAPLLPPGPQLPPGVATTSGHERPGKLGWGWGRHGGLTGEPPAEPAPRAPASGAPPGVARAPAPRQRPRAHSRPGPRGAHAHSPAQSRSPPASPPAPPAAARRPEARAHPAPGARPPAPRPPLTSSVPGPPRRTPPPLSLADGGSGGSGDSDPGVRGTGAQAGSDLPGRFRPRRSPSPLPTPLPASTPSSPL